MALGAAPVTIAFGLDYKVPDAQALASLDEGERRSPAASLIKPVSQTVRTAILRWIPTRRRSPLGSRLGTTAASMLRFLPCSSRCSP